ncbi:MAG: protein serine/threonine phosphatase [Bacteroidetes bacterium]|jgi:serine phosphatase RsbU (regulator of sigma subunit)|nr:protein serine/threonine phosphatase [Bacteroidota bacterium]
MFKNCWNFISDVGCYSELDHSEQRRLQLLNRLNAISFIVLIFYMIVEIGLDVYVFIPYLIFMLSLVLVTFGLLYKKHYRTAKNFSVMALAGCIIFFSINTGDSWSEVLFIPLTAMPLIIFRHKKISVFYLIIILLLTVALRFTKEYFDPLLHLNGDEIGLFRAMNLMTGIVITYFIIYYFKKANETFENQLLDMNAVVSEKNKAITDSINYARHIQNAILPSQRSFKKNFRDAFILYKPKDIVAGDFYWMYANGDKIYFAAADCTGHGVPGAMVSVICANALNRTVKEFGISDTGKVLDKVRELVIDTFIYEDTDTKVNSVKDGMDISLCCLDLKSNELQWSGANNPLWIVRDNSLIEYKPDKQPIGRVDNPKPFKTLTIQLQTNDNLFIFTDGYADQFGGEKGKKFKYSQLKELVIRLGKEKAADQSNQLDEMLESWKGKLEQVDDILLIGIKI